MRSEVADAWRFALNSSALTVGQTFLSAGLLISAKQLRVSNSVLPEVLLI